MSVPVIVKVDLPGVPNFLRLSDSGVVEAVRSPTIHISDIPEEQLREIGAAWTEKLVQNAKKMRRLREESTT